MRGLDDLVLGLARGDGKSRFLSCNDFISSEGKCVQSNGEEEEVGVEFSENNAELLLLQLPLLLKELSMTVVVDGLSLAFSKLETLEERGRVLGGKFPSKMVAAENVDTSDSSSPIV